MRGDVVRRRPRGRWGSVPAVLLAGVATGCDSATSIFAPRGESAGAIAGLGWALTITALLVVLIITVLVGVALFHRRPDSDAEAPIHETGESTARRWILIGTGLSTLVLLGAFLYSLHVLAETSRRTSETAMTVHITGYRFWWAIAYLDTRGRVDFTTANELHIPVGTRVRLVLSAGDVIHSFWVPELAGKTDLIPGQQNVMWIEADSAGRYLGQCAEFCGTAHANMRIVVFADSPDAYAAWAARQRTPAVATRDGLSLLESHGCAACHTIAGTQAAGRAGPDLTHVGGRTTLASGMLPNTRANLAAWLANPDSVKPGALMPGTGRSRDELDTLVRFLEGLR